MAQQRIDSAIASKMSEFFGMTEFDWTPKEERTQAEEWLSEMLQWLSTMMESVLVTLPPDIKMEHYTSAFRNIADSFLNVHLLNKDEPQVSLQGLKNVQADFDFLMLQADRLQSGMSDVFNEVKQTTMLPIEGKLLEYANNMTVRQTRYKDVKPAKLVTLLEKLGRYEGRAGTGERGEAQAAKRRNERDAVLRLVRR